MHNEIHLNFFSGLFPLLDFARKKKIQQLLQISLLEQLYFSFSIIVHIH